MKEKIKGLLAGLIFRVIALLTLGQISPILSACVIIEQEGKLLIVDRSDGMGYTVPGGIVRYRETIEQCLKREVLEETGYTVNIQGIVGVYSEPGRDPRLRAVAIAYKGSVLDGTLRPSGEGIPGWFKPEEVFGRLAFDCDKMLKDYFSGQQSLS